VEDSSQSSPPQSFPEEYQGEVKILKKKPMQSSTPRSKEAWRWIEEGKRQNPPPLCGGGLRRWKNCSDGKGIGCSFTLPSIPSHFVGGATVSSSTCERRGWV